MRAHRVVGVVGALMLLPLPLLAGCGTQVSGPSLVLRLASPDRADDDTGPPIRRFAAEVDRRSGGTIRVDPVWDVAPPGTPDWDQVTLRGVTGGEYELGLVPSRAFDVLGVDSLRALNAPFLVTTQAAEKAVLDSDLRDDLMADLPAAGLAGLDLFPDGLRHPFGYERPLLDAADYDGALIRTGTSDTVARLFAALGASVTDADSATGQGGAESQYSLAPPGAQIATGNVTFFAKTNVLVASRAVADRLRPDQWTVLREAAAATRGWQLGHQPTESEAAATYCRKEGTIVSAGDEQVARLEEEAAPVSDWLSRDPETRRLMDAIGRLVADAPAEEPVTSCPDRTAGRASGARLAVLDGTYAAHVFRRDLVAAGVTDENLLQENSGRIFLTLHAGRWSYRTKANHFVSNPVDHGPYDVAGSTFTFFWDLGDGDWTRMRFRAGPDGTLHFSDILDGQRENQELSEGWFGVPWVRVGDASD